MDEALVEKVAEAIYNATWEPGAFHSEVATECERDEARAQARAALSAVIPLIEAAALERAAKVAMDHIGPQTAEHMAAIRALNVCAEAVNMAMDHQANRIATAIRSLKEPPETEKPDAVA